MTEICSKTKFEIEVFLNSLKQQYKMNLTRLDEKKRELQENEKNYKIYQEASWLLDALKHQRFTQRKNFILDVINSALNEIFESNYRLNIEPKINDASKTHSSLKYSIQFFENDLLIAEDENLLKSKGGGVLSVVSFLFKIMIGFLYSGNRFFMFDESLSQLSPMYRNRFSNFLRQFSIKHGFTVVVVSQTATLDEYAHWIIEVSKTFEKGIPKLILEKRIKNFDDGEDIERAPKFKVSIKNFQSIQELNLTLQGFVIIRGPNDSGKSAIIRAINSIIFNDFDCKLYPRYKNSEGGKLKSEQTDIRFSLIKNEKQKISIGLKCKNSQLIFIIDGEEYYGKNLAKTAHLKAIEKLGFKTVNLRKKYKNFKGSLRDQTERLSYTSQHDSLYIVGSKKSESEKLFEFLFNTEHITTAQLHINEQLRNTKQLINQLIIEIENIERELNRFKTDIENYTLCFQYKLLNSYQELVEKMRLSESDLIERKKQLGLIKTDVVIFEQISILLQLYKKKAELKKRYDQFLSQYSNIKTVLTESESLSFWINYFKHYLQLLSNLEKTNYLIDSYQNQLKNLNKKYNIKECECCSALGYIPLYEGEHLDGYQKQR